MNKDAESSIHLEQRVFGLDNPNLTFTSDGAPLSMIWLDPARLSRECLVGAVAAAHAHISILPCETLEECIGLSGEAPNLVVYYSHSEDTVDLSVIDAIHAAYPDARIVVLSDAASLVPSVVRDILTQGVSGFILTRRTGLQMMVSALSLVHSGGTFVPRDFLFMDGPAILPTMRKPTEGRLTQREQAVLDLIRHGKPNKLIAEELGMSASTVKVHVRNIMQKMGVSNRTQVALNAMHFLGPNH